MIVKKKNSLLLVPILGHVRGCFLHLCACNSFLLTLYTNIFIIDSDQHFLPLSINLLFRLLGPGSIPVLGLSQSWSLNIYIYIYIYIVMGLLFCLRNDAYERQSIPFFLEINLYSWGSKRYQLLKSNIYKRRYACKKINMIFICKFIILLSDFRIKLLKNKRKHKKKEKMEKWTLMV